MAQAQDPNTAARGMGVLPPPVQFPNGRAPSQVASVPTPPTPATLSNLPNYIGPNAGGDTSVALRAQAASNFANGDTATAVGNTVGAAGAGMLHALLGPVADLDQARASDARALGQTVSHFAGGLFGHQPQQALPTQVAAPVVAPVAAPVVAAPLPAGPVGDAFGVKYHMGMGPTPEQAALIAPRFTAGNPAVAAPVAALPAPAAATPTVLRNGAGGGPLIIGGVSGGGMLPAAGRAAPAEQNAIEKGLDVPAGSISNMKMPRGSAQKAELLAKMAALQSTVTANQSMTNIMGQSKAWLDAATQPLPGETPDQTAARVAVAQKAHFDRILAIRSPAAAQAGMLLGNAFGAGTQ